jgi:hypothetical protein
LRQVLPISRSAASSLLVTASLVLTTNWTKDSLKAMPDYKYERRQTQR